MTEYETIMVKLKVAELGQNQVMIALACNAAGQEQVATDSGEMLDQVIEYTTKILGE